MRILALVDTSLYGRSVIDYASWAAATANATLQVLHVISPNELLASRMPAHPGGAVILSGEMTYDEDLAELRTKAGVLLAEARTTLMSRGLTDVHTRIEEGNVLELATEAAAKADLVIMGKRGEHADLARLPLGSNVERIVRACSSPVLAVSRAYRPVRRGLLAFEQDDEASAAAVEALATSNLLPPMPLLLLHVGKHDEQIHTALTKAAERLRHAGFDVNTEIVDGEPERVIPERVVLDNSDIVIMGAFGRSQLKSLIFGSLTHEIMRACQTPVLLVK
jgi:nucleotide-binding universal stress UspA family protein